MACKYVLKSKLNFIQLNWNILILNDLFQFGFISFELIRSFLISLTDYKMKLNRG